MSKQVDTRALRALMEKATPRPWGKTPHEEKNDVCIWKPDGSWLANVGNWARCTIVVDGELVAPDNIETIEVEHDANAALIVALVNAAPALLDAADERDEISASWNKSVAEFSRLVRYKDEIQNERDALRARVGQLEVEVERVRRQNEIAHRALAEAGNRFAAGDMEGVRLLLCDRNAQSNAAALAPRAEVKP